MFTEFVDRRRLVFSNLILIAAITILAFAIVATQGTQCAQAAVGSCPVGDSETFTSNIVVNDDGDDADTRIEGDTDPNLFYLDASNDRIGIGTDAPTAKFDVNGGAVFKNGGVTMNDTAGDYDFNVKTDSTAAALNVDSGVNAGAGSVTLGFTANPNPSRRAWFKVYGPPLTTAVNIRTFWASIEGGYPMTMSGTVPVAATLGLIEPNISGSPTDAATLYIENAPSEGTNGNYALFVDAGDIRADGDILFGTDGVSDIGKTGTRAANVWADLINGADYGFENGWRAIEADTYSGYGPGIAFDYGPYFQPGKALAVERFDTGRTELIEVGENPDGSQRFEQRPVIERRRVTNVAQTPVFAVTADFIEFNGIRITTSQWAALAALVN